MLTYHLVNNLNMSEDQQWQKLLVSTLGEEVHPSRKRGFCLAREALRRCFKEKGQELSIPQLQLEHYRRVKEQDLWTVSISHTKEWGAAVIGETKSYLSVGIDIEPLERVVKEAIISRIAHPLDATLEPIKLWALKEACFKALMNSGKFSANEEFSSINIQHNGWGHPSSGLKGEWKTDVKEGQLLALAWIST